MKFQRLFLLLPVLVIFISCGTQKKTPQYLEQFRDTTIKNTVRYPELKIQKNDLLSIFVYSDALEKEKVDAIYNLPASTTTASSTTGFLVDVNGDIEYPGIGKIHAEGMTKLQLAEHIKDKLGKQEGVLKNPSVIIRWLNYKITLIGEVNKEGLVNLPGEKVNILEAIGLAGGITQYGKKESVRVIREIDGNREIGTIDLTAKDVFASPYYYLVQNDIILVEPSKAKARPEDAITWQKITAVVGLVTSLVFIYDRIFNNN
jgi:polysaccharide export outer membrane protein